MTDNPVDLIRVSQVEYRHLWQLGYRISSERSRVMVADFPIVFVLRLSPTTPERLDAEIITSAISNAKVISRRVGALILDGLHQILAESSVFDRGQGFWMMHPDTFNRFVAQGVVTTGDLFGCTIYKNEGIPMYHERGAILFGSIDNLTVGFKQGEPFSADYFVRRPYTVIGGVEQ